MSGGCACGKVRFTREGRRRRRLSVPLPDVPARERQCQPGDEECRAGGRRVGRRARLVRQFGRSPSGPFCARCGTSLGFRFNEGSEKMDLTVAASTIRRASCPTSHFGAESMHGAWLNTEACREQRTDDYQPLVDRWANATGRPCPS